VIGRSQFQYCSFFFLSFREFLHWYIVNANDARLATMPIQIPIIWAGDKLDDDGDDLPPTDPFPDTQLTPVPDEDVILFPQLFVFDSIFGNGRANADVDNEHQAKMVNRSERNKKLGMKLAFPEEPDAAVQLTWTPVTLLMLLPHAFEFEDEEVEVEVDSGGNKDDKEEADLAPAQFFVTMTDGLMQATKVLDVIVHAPSEVMLGHVIEDRGRPPVTTQLGSRPAVHSTALQQADPAGKLPPTTCVEAHRAALCITV